MDSLAANGWTNSGVNDFQVCGLGGCTVGWCGNPCSGTQEYAGFWAGGDATGSISYALPSGFNRGVITVGMTCKGTSSPTRVSCPGTYLRDCVLVADSNPACHGTVTVGTLVLMDNTGGGDVLKLEFMYQDGDTVTVTEEGTCVVDIYELKVTSSGEGSDPFHNNLISGASLTH